MFGSMKALNNESILKKYFQSVIRYHANKPWLAADG